MSEWIAVPDRRPPDNRRVLLYWFGLSDMILIGSYTDVFGWTADGRRCPAPTHWMPLPESPEVFAP